jgi:hypothetical protein
MLSPLSYHKPPPSCARASDAFPDNQTRLRHWPYGAWPRTTRPPFCRGHDRPMDQDQEPNSFGDGGQGVVQSSLGLVFLNEYFLPDHNECARAVGETSVVVAIRSSSGRRRLQNPCCLGPSSSVREALKITVARQRADFPALST